MPEKNTLRLLKKIPNRTIRLKASWKELRIIGSVGLVIIISAIVFKIVFAELLDFQEWAFMFYGIFIGAVLAFIGISRSLHHITVNSFGIKGSTREHKVNFPWYRVKEVIVSPDGEEITFRTSNRVFRIPIGEMEDSSKAWFMKHMMPLLDESSLPDPQTNNSESDLYF